MRTLRLRRTPSHRIAEAPATDLPAAPPCPAWCESHPSPGSWDLHPSATTKTCVCSLESAPTVDGLATVLTLERFAELTSRGVAVDDPVLRLEIGGSMTRAHALTLSADIALIAGRVA